MGLRYYRSRSAGIGGRLKDESVDFRVSERHDLAVQPVDADPGDYPHLLLQATLTDWETNQFVDVLADHLSVHPEAIAWAGTKDANAVTTQLLSVRGVDPSEIPDLSGADLEVIGRFGRALEFGDHAGNDFDVIVREPSHPERLEAIVTELRKAGSDRLLVPNFFGHQRFGTRRPVTHAVGRDLLRGDHIGAVTRYLTTTSQHEPARTRRFRRMIENEVLPTDNWKRAAEAVPGYLTFEGTLVTELAKASELTEDTALSALAALPWSLRRLFVHAVQSHVFNEIVSERLRRGVPLETPVVGDRICLLDNGRIDPERPQQVSADRLHAARRHCESGRAAVVAPLVGSETQFGTGEVGTIERAVLAGLDLERSAFGDVLDTEQPGSYRRIDLDPAVDIEREPVRFRFGLPPGSYATVVLREFLKTDPVAFG